MTEHSEHKRLRVVIAFSLVYIFWGSTYLGIRIGIEHLPPLVMTGTRFTIAGVLMLAYCATNGREIRISLPQAVRLADIGNLGVPQHGPCLPSWDSRAGTGIRRHHGAALAAIDEHLLDRSP